MDLEGQGRIKQVVEASGTENVVAVLGANSATAVEMTAVTLKSGDPSYAGPLAGIALGIPSFHILEPEIVQQVDPAVYERELALSAMAMDVAQIIEPLRTIREEVTA
jgi:betaine reductase